MNQASKSFVVRQTPKVPGQVQRILTFHRASKRIGEHRVNPLEAPKQEGVFGFGGKEKKRRNKGLGGSQGGGNLF